YASTLAHRTPGRGGRCGEKRGGPGGAARRSVAEPDELRIPPGSWDAPKGRATSGKAGPGGWARGGAGGQVEYCWHPCLAFRSVPLCGGPRIRRTCAQGATFG